MPVATKWETATTTHAGNILSVAIVKGFRVDEGMPMDELDNRPPSHADATAASINGRKLPALKSAVTPSWYGNGIRTAW